MTKHVEKTKSYDSNHSSDTSSDLVPTSLSELGTRIAVLADRIGTRKSAAIAMGVSVDSLQRYIRNENMPPFDVLMRLTNAAGASLDWLATGEVQETPIKQDVSVESQPVRSEDLIISMDLADEALDGRTLPRDKYAKLVALICDAIVNGLPEAQILRFARPAAKGLDD